MAARGARRFPTDEGRSAPREHPCHGVAAPPLPLTPLRRRPGGDQLIPCGRDDWGNIPLTGDGVPDLPGQFFAAAEDGEWLAAWPTSDVVEWPRYTETGDNNGGANNHFQGFQRLRAPGYAVISGGDPHAPMSHLFVLRLESRGNNPVWGSNLLLGSSPPREDRLVARVDLNGTLWHGGGMATLGDVLAVPIENSGGGGSRIEFLCFTNPERPTSIRCAIDRGAAKAGAVALTRLADGRFLAAVWSDSEPEQPKKHLDLYVTDTDCLADTRWSGPMCFTQAVADIPKFQTVALLWDLDDRGERTDLYLLGFENGAALAPDPHGPHEGRLYHVILPGAAGGPGSTLELTPVGDPKPFHCSSDYSDMDAATGIFVGPDGTLSIYCAHHFLRETEPGERKFVLRFEEFASSGPNPGPVAAVEDTRVGLFDGPNFTGDRVTLFGAVAAHVEDLDRLLVRGKPFAHRVSSLECQLPPGFVLAVFREPGFRGDAPLVIRGTGNLVTVSDLADHGFTDLARSCRIVASGVARGWGDATWIDP